MKKKKQSKFKYTVPVYDIVVEVYLCKYEELPHFLRKEENENAGFTIRATKEGVKKICVWIDDFDWTSKRMGTLVHELSHVVDEIDEIKGTEFNTEGRAYLLGNLVEHFFFKIGRIYK